MKNIGILKITFFFLILLFTGSMEAQETFEYKNSVKLNPVEMANAELKLTYERFFSNRKYSVSLMPSIIYFKDGDEYEQGWQFIGQLRWYALHLNEMNGTKVWFFENIGIYGGVYGLYLDYEERDMYYSYDPVTMEDTFLPNDITVTGGEGGVILGVQFDITKRFCLDFFFGGGLRIANVEVNETDQYYYNNRTREGVKPIGGLQFGLYF